MEMPRVSRKGVRLHDAPAVIRRSEEDGTRSSSAVGLLHITRRGTTIGMEGSPPGEGTNANVRIGGPEALHLVGGRMNLIYETRPGHCEILPGFHSPIE